MKQFIPAWYDSTYWWDSTVQPFYSKRRTTEFDDMVSLMSMHLQNEESFQTLILNYNPMLRLFLHRHQLYEMSYWSLFDDIQGAQQCTPKAIDYRDLDWSEYTEFVYTPFQVIAITGPNAYSKVIFSQEGYLLWIEDYDSHQRQRKFIFDDRGFISAIDIYENNHEIPHHRVYLNVSGNAVMTQDFTTQKITIHSDFDNHFRKTEYETMDDLIHEKLLDYNQTYLEENDKIIVAADKRHNVLISQTFKPKNICFSVFKPRNQEMDDELLNSITKAQQCLIDTLENERKVKAYLDNHVQNQPFNYMRVTPFDAQVLPNISSQLYDTNIGVWIDDLLEQELKDIMFHLTRYLYQHEHTRIHVLTRLNKNEVPQWLKDDITRLNDSFNTDNEELAPEVRDILESELQTTEVIKVISVPFEEDLMKAISQLRVVIDLNQEPDLYLQISSISAGVPQINLRQTDYVEHELNGLIIETYEQLGIALDFFLINLKNWNYSFAHSIKLSHEFSSQFIIQQLDYLIEGEYDGT
ncbi:accessory Sec system protein Asp1 [Staphylococcus petrasii]|uniref:accessory Sec system protein Asp1 n=1 Tax=Staphylococcus petrasii TaxID=1276936 RepID=UPI001F5648A2|nr:accessory Sec system protein Asp1 [Staphylococcus petrasii]MCI2774180.1 accessory Sec system protein Asp1 [Staphylococcus petrasii]